MFHLIFLIVALSPAIADVRVPSSSEDSNFTVSFFSTSNNIQQSDEVILFDHANYGGDSKKVRISGGDCVNVLDFNDRASSVKIDDGCVRLWEHDNCIGRSVDIQAPGESWLPGLDFNDKTTSVSSCNFPCYNENVEIVMHLNGADDLAGHAEEARKVMVEWFPQIQSLLYTTAYRAIPRIDVYYDDKDYNGNDFVAYAWVFERKIHVHKGYIRGNQGDMGMYIHEMTHVIHESRNCPGWMVEGMAEYTRRWLYEPYTTPTKPTDENLNSNPYAGDWLIYYLSSVIKKPLFYQMTKACQEGTWYDNWLKDKTGKDDQTWWREMIKNNNYPWKRVR